MSYETFPDSPQPDRQAARDGHADAPGAPVTQRIRALLPALESGLLERDTAARLVLLAALAGQHALLIGPPGTAKSELARRLHRCFEGSRYFERLLTRFSTPEELFGPLSLKALEDDRYERQTEGFLPTAGIAFLDEVFKANSAILNALLTLLNEREFDNGAGRRSTPLISVVGASNEVPADEALLAFYDRFLLRVPVGPVRDDSFISLLGLPALGAAAPAQPLDTEDLGELARAAAQVVLSPQALDAAQALRARLAEAGRSLSDRRWRQWMGLMRVAAAAEERDAVDLLDFWLAPYVALHTPDDADGIAQWFERECLQAVPRKAEWLTRAVQAFERQLQIEESAGAADGGDDAAGKLALARAIGMTEAAPGNDPASGPLRMVSERLEDGLRQRYSSVHVAARLAQVDELLAHAQRERERVADELAQLQARLAGRFWIPPSLASRWQDAHGQSLAVIDGLLSSLQQTRTGFAGLTVDDGLPPQVPAPVKLEPEPA